MDPTNSYGVSFEPPSAANPNSLLKKFKAFEGQATVRQQRFYGVKSFQAPSIIFQETILFESNSKGKAQLAELGRVSKPPSAVNDYIDYVQIPNAWLMIGCDGEQVGYGYKITRQWKLAGNLLGWNPYIYEGTIA